MIHKQEQLLHSHAYTILYSSSMFIVFDSHDFIVNNLFINTVPDLNYQRIYLFVS